MLTALLPIAWIFGTLPPLDALILFLLEQCHVFAFGGSPVSSTIRLVIQIIGAALLSLVFFIPNNLAIILLLANFGYIFASLDGGFLLKKCIRVLKPKQVNSKCHVPIESQYNWKDWTFHFVMIILVNLITVLTYILLKSSSANQAALFTLETSFLYAGLGLFVAIKLLGDVQRVYIIFGLIRNPFYPKNSLSASSSSSTMKSVNEKRVAFTVVKYIRLVLLRIVAPCLLCAFVATDCVLYELNFNAFDYLQIICILRAFRWIWQSTFVCLFEMCFMSNVLLYAIIHPSSSSSVTQLQLTKYFLLGCLAASFVRDRLEQLIGKTFTFFMITITAWSVKKQRRTAALVLLVLNFLLFLPIGLVYIGVVSLLSAPLLALFTFPIYLIGFPRYKRFWPEKKQQISPKASVVPYSNVDGIFYHQLMPTLLESFKEHIRSASIGEGIKPDTFYLSRFQDRIIWIQILEGSSTGYVMNIKGLELQETSCHTREAQHIDDIFDLAFENPDGSSGNSERNKLISLNPSIFGCMQPLDVLVFQGYSDAKNSLVGILDNPETIQFGFYEFFPKILHYFLVQKLIERTKSVDTVAVNEITGIDNMGNSLEDDELDTNGNYGESKTPSANSIKSKSREAECKFDILNKSIQSEDSFVQVAKDIKEESASNWSDSSSDNDGEKAIKKPKAKLSTLSSKVAPKLKTDSALRRTSYDYDFNELLGAINMDNETVENSATHTKLSRENSEGLKKTYEKKNSSFKQQKQTEVELGPIKHKKAPVIAPVTVSKRPMSSQRSVEQATFSLPRDWVQGVKDSGMSNQRLQADNEAVKKTLMSKEWISQLFKHLDRPDLEQEYETALNSGVCVFILRCCNLLGINKSSVNFNPASICTFYAGKLPWSPLNERITNEHPDLFALLVKAFRYTVKMVVDNVTICPIGDDADFYETLNEYRSDWFIGVEKDPEFSENLLQNKNYLFSLYKDDTNVS